MEVYLKKTDFERNRACLKQVKSELIQNAGKDNFELKKKRGKSEKGNRRRTTRHGITVHNCVQMFVCSSEPPTNKKNHCPKYAH